MTCNILHLYFTINYLIYIYLVKLTSSYMVDKWNKLTNGMYLFIVIRYVMVILGDHKLCLSPIQVQPVSRSLVTTASTKLPMLANVIRASSIVSITCDMAPVKPFKVDIARSASSSKSCKTVCMYVLFVRFFSTGFIVSIQR